MDSTEPDTAGREPDDGLEEYGLIDLGGLSIGDVMQLDPSVLVQSLRRIQDEIDHPQEPVAGWQSAL